MQATLHIAHRQPMWRIWGEIERGGILMQEPIEDKRWRPTSRPLVSHRSRSNRVRRDLNELWDILWNASKYLSPAPKDSYAGQRNFLAPVGMLTFVVPNTPPGSDLMDICSESFSFCKLQLYPQETHAPLDWFQHHSLQRFWKINKSY